MVTNYFEIHFTCLTQVSNTSRAGWPRIVKLTSHLYCSAPVECNVEDTVTEMTGDIVSNIVKVESMNAVQQI